MRVFDIPTTTTPCGALRKKRRAIVPVETMLLYGRGRREAGTESRRTDVGRKRGRGQEEVRMAETIASN